MNCSLGIAANVRTKHAALPRHFTTTNSLRAAGQGGASTLCFGATPSQMNERRALCCCAPWPTAPFGHDLSHSFGFRTVREFSALSRFHSQYSQARGGRTWRVMCSCPSRVQVEELFVFHESAIEDDLHLSERVFRTQY